MTDEMTVLVVEDNARQVELLRGVMTIYSGQSVFMHHVPSLVKALEFLEVGRTDVILLDLNLPDSKGIETYDKVHEKCPDIPVVILSGTEDEELAVNIVKKGAQDYLIKLRDDGRTIYRSLRYAVERKRYELEMRRLQGEITRERRLESLGVMVSGLAHEINTPIQFVNTNLQFMMKAFKTIESIVDRNMMLADQRLGRKDMEAVLHEIVDLMRRTRYPYIRKEFALAIEESLEGVKRVKSIIDAMGVFSHTPESSPVLYDVNRAIRDAVTITRNEWKAVAEMKLELDEALPRVECYPESISQVFLNLIMNAVYAIEARREKDGSAAEKGVITIATTSSDGSVVVSMADNGCGIPEDIQNRIYDPFFTTKPVGKGSGQGLCFAYNMVVRKHNGRISFVSDKEKGTVFRVVLPVSPGAGGAVDPEVEDHRISA